MRAPWRGGYRGWPGGRRRSAGVGAAGRGGVDVDVVGVGGVAQIDAVGVYRRGGLIRTATLREARELRSSASGLGGHCRARWAGPSADGCSRLVRALAPDRSPSRRNGQPAPATPARRAHSLGRKAGRGQRVVPGLRIHHGEGCLWQRVCQWPCQCRLSGDAEFDRIDSRHASVLGVLTAQSVPAMHLLIS
jgi:hypothetical protein